MMTRKQKLAALCLGSLIGLVCLAAFVPQHHPAAAAHAFDPADVAWMLSASGLVLLMTPGLAFFYGGMVSRRNVIGTMLQSFIALGVVSVLWYAVGFSLAFGDSLGGWLGDPRTFLLFDNVGTAPHPRLAPTLPLVLFAAFQLKFAIVNHYGIAYFNILRKAIVAGTNALGISYYMVGGDGEHLPGNNFYTVVLNLLNPDFRPLQIL